MYNIPEDEDGKEESINKKPLLQMKVCEESSSCINIGSLSQITEITFFDPHQKSNYHV